VNLLSILPGVLKTVARVTGLAPLANAADLLSTAQIPPEKQLELQQALMEHELAMKQAAVEEYKATVDVIKTEATSEDKYVRRARPSFLYLMYIVLGVNYVITPIIHMFILTVTPYPIPPDLLVLFGSGYLGYSYLRTKDKQAGNA
jgi:hypothetical protein